jgi:2-dehydro-3-deoxy-D-arabinonate dehydratase
MHLGQILWNHQTTAAVFENGHARPIPEHTVADLIARSEKEGIPIPALAASMASAHPEPPVPLIPLRPKEVWACGCTYETSASFRDGACESIYTQVYKAARPETFFKGTARTCVGPGQPIGIRTDSKYTVPEPELALVLGSRGRIVGYTLANDVSAWDIARENPLYLAQAKTYTGACAIGPVIVTADELTSPRDLTITCTITRNGETLFSGETSTSRLNRTLETLIEYLLRANPVPAGSVLLTGTGIMVNEEAALAEGDVVTIRAPQIGVLTNVAALVK